MPRCDTSDGQVVKTAKQALVTGNLNHVMIWVPQAAEKEI